jgi:hypothetical protein
MVKRSAKLGNLQAVGVGLALCPPIDDRLNQLWYVVRSQGHPISRQDIVAALILNSPTTAGDIKRLVDGYKETDERTARIPGIRLPRAPKRPGRRKL